jgi:hypothetical protein
MHGRDMSISNTYLAGSRSILSISPDWKHRSEPTLDHGVDMTRLHLSRTIWIACLSFTAVLSAGCGSVEPTESKAVEIFPLRIGNSWSGTSYNYDTSGNIRSQTSGTITVNRDTLIDGRNWYGLSNGWFFSSQPDGIHAADPTGKSNSRLLLFAYPIELGATWIGVDGRSDTIDISVIDTAVVVKAAGREWKCYRYNVTLRPYTAITDYYLAPGVGLIMTEHRDQLIDGGDVMSRFMLDEYHVQ